MGVEDWQRLRDLFEAAMERAVEDRAAFLEASCKGDESFRARIEAYLRLHEEAASFLERPLPLIQQDIEEGPRVPDAESRRPATAADDPFTDEATSLVGQRLGRYTIEKRLAAGGMGVVYLAEQQSPHRKVALKVLRSEFASPRYLRRFEQEAQVLGRLQHPGIAQIFESGVSDDAAGPRPFFAMELVRGRSLLAYAEAERIGSRQRLGLIVKVCEAVQHAHGKGIIHRDLKPANILVDGEGQPKVLDFGIARATDVDIMRTTLRTDVGQLIGTLPYMSPEQVAGDPHDLDTRSDVYALGVLMYELLTGRLPYEVHKKAVPEAVRVIVSEDPTPLSVINRVFRGDLETIVSKAMEKDRARRYASASDLAADIRRYLRDEPIAARPPSAGYQLRKLVRRHRLPFALAATVFALVSVSAVVAMLQAARIAWERDRAERVNAYLQKMLASFTPANSNGGTLTLQEVLDEAARRVETDLADQPEAAATLRETIGNGYRGLGMFEAAEPHLNYALQTRRKIHGDGSLPVAQSQTSLAMLLQDQGRYAAAEALLVKALETRRRRLGNDHPDVTASLTDLGLCRQATGDYATAEPLLREALATRRRTQGEGSLDVATSMINVAALLQTRGDWLAGERLYKEALEASRQATEGEPPPGAERFAGGNVSAAGLSDRAWDDYTAAEGLYREALAVKLNLLGAEHPEVASTMYDLGSVLMGKARRGLMLVISWNEKKPEAERLFREALATRRRIYGEKHPIVATSLYGLGAMLCSKGTVEGNREGEQVLREALAMRRELLGNEHPDVADCLSQLAAKRVGVGDPRASLPLYREAAAIQRRVLGGRHPDLAFTLQGLADALVIMGQYETARPLMEEALSIHRSVYGNEHPVVANAIVHLADLSWRQGRTSEAVAMGRESLAIHRRVFGDDHIFVSGSLRALATFLEFDGKPREAVTVLREAVAIQQQRLADGTFTDPVYLQRLLAGSKVKLGTVMTETGDFVGGEAEVREGLALQRRLFPPGNPWIGNGENALGVCLLIQHRYAEAEPFLVESLPKVRAAHGETDIRTRRAMERIVELYEGWGKREMAARYRELLARDFPAAAPGPE